LSATRTSSWRIPSRFKIPDASGEGVRVALAKAQEKVKLYEGILESAMDASQKEFLKLSMSMHKREISMYKNLLANAEKKLES
jgi:hypothetical protein